MTLDFQTEAVQITNNVLTLDIQFLCKFTYPHFCHVFIMTY